MFLKLNLRRIENLYSAACGRNEKSEVDLWLLNRSAAQLNFLGVFSICHSGKYTLNQKWENSGPRAKCGPP